MLQPDNLTQANGTHLWPDENGRMVPLGRLSDRQLVFIAQNQVGKLAPPSTQGDLAEIIAAQNEQWSAALLVKQELELRGFHNQSSELFNKVKQDFRDSNEVVYHQMDKIMHFAKAVDEELDKAKVERERERDRKIAEAKAFSVKICSDIAVSIWMSTQEHGESGRQHWSKNAPAGAFVRFKKRPDSWTITDVTAAPGSDVAVVTLTISWRAGSSSEWSITLDGLNSLDSGVRAKIVSVHQK